MSRAYRTVDADGDVGFGIDGSGGRVPYISEIDVAGDDPFAPVVVAAPFGSQHHRPRFASLVVTGYDPPELLNEKTYRINVVYGPASDRTIGLWRRSVRFASETRLFAISLGEYDKNGTLVTPGIEVAAFQYEPVVQEGTGAQKVGEYRTSTGIQLNRKAETKQLNISTNSTITAIIYEILVPQLSAHKLRVISNLKWSTNKYPWLGYDTWTLIFSNCEVNDEVLVFPTTGRPSAAWYSNVTIEILYRPRSDFFPFGWRAQRLFERFAKDDGYAYQVFANESVESVPQAVSRTFIEYQETSFNDIFNQTGGGIPGK